MTGSLKITKLDIRDAFIVDIIPRSDDRGFFARTYCEEEFAAVTGDARPVQANTSYNFKAGTLRGMHYQLHPYEETKLVRCIRGAIVDVIVDVKPDSPTFGKHVMVELTAENRRALFVPKDYAHGFQTLTDDTEVTYQVSAAYTPNSERGLRYNDPALGIDWPMPVSVISDKDANWPDFAMEAAR